MNSDFPYSSEVPTQNELWSLSSFHSGSIENEFQLDAGSIFEKKFGRQFCRASPTNLENIYGSLKRPPSALDEPISSCAAACSSSSAAAVGGVATPLTAPNTPPPPPVAAAPSAADLAPSHTVHHQPVNLSCVYPNGMKRKILATNRGTMKLEFEFDMCYFFLVFLLTSIRWELGIRFAASGRHQRPLRPTQQVSYYNNHLSASVERASHKRTDWTPMAMKWNYYRWH